MIKRPGRSGKGRLVFRASTPPKRVGTVFASPLDPDRSSGAKTRADPAVVQYPSSMCEAVARVVAPRSPAGDRGLQQP